MAHSIMLITRTEIIASYCTVHIIHCNGSGFKMMMKKKIKTQILKCASAFEFSKPSTLALYHNVSNSTLGQDLKWLCSART
jgi:hypothetical protein